MNRIQKYMVVIAASCMLAVAKANTGHVIVAFDQAIPHYKSVYNDASTIYTIDNFLKKEFQFDDMYLSVLGYAMNGKYPSIENFVIPYKDKNNDPITWSQYNSLCDLFPHWPMGEPTGKYQYESPASMQSLAKPYCVMETAIKDKKNIVDATYILFVTDEKVQGVDDDYAGEWNSMRHFNSTAYDKIHDVVFEKLRHFNETYRFELRNRKTIEKDYVIVSYELLPSEQPSIYSVSDLPSPLPIKRVRGGYNLACKVESRNSKYEIEDWAVYSTSGTLFKRKKGGELFVKSSDLRDGDTLDIRMIVRLSDNLYGGALLSRKNCPGMSLRQAVKLQDEAKVLGVMPLSDVFWWWFPNDIMTAVIIWDLLILLALIALTIMAFYMLFVAINTYHPDNKNLRLKKI